MQSQISLSDAIRLGSTRTIKLSDALRLGSVLPGFNWRDPNHCFCGKALEAIGAQRRSGSIHQLKNYWPWVEDRTVPCPITGCRSTHQRDGAGVASMISDAGYIHEMTFAQLADWIATIEPQPIAALFDEPERGERLEDWAKANVEGMECRHDEECDHCVLVQILKDKATLDGEETR